jgi:hypothetical protein
MVAVAMVRNAEVAEVAEVAPSAGYSGEVVPEVAPSAAVVMVRGSADKRQKYAQTDGQVTDSERDFLNKFS